MFCNNCGKEIPDTAEFCRHCGHKRGVKGRATPTPEPTSKPVVTSKKTGVNWLVWVVGGILAVGINYLGASITIPAGLPVWLDTIGTVAFTFIAGPLAGIAVTVVSLFLISQSYFESGLYFLPVINDN